MQNTNKPEKCGDCVSFLRRRINGTGDCKKHVKRVFIGNSGCEDLKPLKKLKEELKK